MKKLSEVFLYMVIITVLIRLGQANWIYQSRVIASLSDKENSVSDLCKSLRHFDFEHFFVEGINLGKGASARAENALSKLLPHNIVEMPASGDSYHEAVRKFGQVIKDVVKPGLQKAGKMLSRLQFMLGQLVRSSK